MILHRDQQIRVECDKGGVTSGQFDSRNIEREANEFASNLLMPIDVLRRLLGDQRKVTLHLLSDIARTFEVSFEALCLRFIEATDQRAILVHWDQGFLKYQRPSRNARMTGARVRETDSAQEPFAGTLAADASVAQPAHKAGFLLPGIPRRCGISGHSAGATPRTNVARNSPSSTLLWSLFSTCPHQPVVVGTRRIPDAARSYAGVAKSGWQRRLEQQSAARGSSAR